MVTMIQHIKEFNRHYNYLSDIEGLYGKHGGYYFTAIQLDQKNMIGLTFSVTDVNAILPEIEALRTQYESMPHGGVYADGPELIVELNMVNMNDSQDLVDIVEAITKVMRNHNSQNQCSISGSTEDIGIFRIGTKMLILSEAAYRAQVHTNEAQYNHKEPAPIVPFLGALGGMLLGVGVWILFSMIRIVTGLAGYFILKFGLNGYEKMGGSVTKRVAKILIGLSVVMIVFAQILTYAWPLFMNGVPFFMSFKIVVAQIFNGSIATNFIINIAIGIGLSLWSSWGLINHLLNFAPTSTKRVRRKNNRLL